MVPEIKNVLMPTDFSPTSKRALEYAQALASRFGAKLHLLHVLAYPMSGVATPEAYWVELTDLRKRLRDDVDRDMAALAASLAGIELSTKVLDGPPAPTIVAAAKDLGCDLIVMGTHGHSGIAHLLLGSVAERVVRTAPCPVLTVSSAGAA
jgi:nucleotide-binding universal stress UspA family protein